MFVTGMKEIVEDAEKENDSMPKELAWTLVEMTSLELLNKK